jgi:hypothetical protein
MFSDSGRQRVPEVPVWGAPERALQISGRGRYALAAERHFGARLPLTGSASKARTECPLRARVTGRDAAPGDGRALHGHAEFAPAPRGRRLNVIPPAVYSASSTR